ncbi:MAG: hypothetical protein M3361_04970 [Candidatus Tectomicrobia bacterium]|nr:hypothetical protein [Candidatus Tectomicrobia bacterium]
MATIASVYHTLCTEDRIPESRQKDVLTALRYLAAAYDSTFDALILTPAIERTYRDTLREYLMKAGKKASTIRNSIQGVGQFLRARDELPPGTPLAQTRRNRLYEDARIQMGKTSPYRHQGWMTHSKYTMLRRRWPEEVRAAYEVFEERKRLQVRPDTVKNYDTAVRSLLGYLSLSAEERLDHLPSEARQKLQRKEYVHDLRMIRATSQTVAWDDLFVLQHVQSFLCWHAWRAHTPEDAKVRERRPHFPTQLGVNVANAMMGIAQTLGRSAEYEALRSYRWSLPRVRKLHDKAAPYHQFSFAEIERIALALMDEARRMRIETDGLKSVLVDHPGGMAASRFMTGLVLMIGWRIPLRARNWCECLIDTHLRKVGGDWRFHFEGRDLKIETRNGRTNVLDLPIPAEVVPYLEEYLDVWRPMLPYAQEDRHLLLALRGEGGMQKPRDLCHKLKIHTYRFVEKRMFTHLLRTIFQSNMFSTPGVDLNSIAFAMGDLPETTVGNYNEFQVGKHEDVLQDAYRRVLQPVDAHGTARG